MYNPTIKDKVIVIDEELTSPNAKPSTSKKVFEIIIQKKKPKKEDLTTNKKAPKEKDKFSARKQSKQSMKGPKPLIIFEDGKTRRMKTCSETKQTRGNNLDLLVEAAKFVFQGEVSI